MICIYFLLIILYFFILFFHSLYISYNKLTLENKQLNQKLFWDKALKTKLADMKTNYDGIGGFIETTKEYIDNGQFDNIEERIDQLPKEYLETIVADRIIKHGLEIYQWIDKIFGYPVKYPNKSYLSSEFFHQRIINDTVVYHGGIDIVCTNDFSILASSDGVVREAGYNDLLGNYILIKHIINGVHYITEYAHASVIYVKIGQQVNKGEIIGIIGLTGNTSGYHLHFAVKKWDEILQMYIPINMVATTSYGIRIK